MFASHWLFLGAIGAVVGCSGVVSVHGLLPNDSDATEYAQCLLLSSAGANSSSQKLLTIWRLNDPDLILCNAWTTNPAPGNCPSIPDLDCVSCSGNNCYPGKLQSSPGVGLVV